MSYIGRTPTPAALTASDIADGIITEAKMADDAISITELKAGTDGNIISYDASGDPVAIATGTDGQVLTSAGAGQPPAFEAGGLTGVTTGSGNVTISNGNLILGTSGNGIDFSASTADGTGTVAVELLDDYEEGSFTMTVSGGTMTYTRNTGYYTKIGNLVYFQIYFVVDTYTSGSRVDLTGLPYTAVSNHGDGHYPVTISRWENMNYDHVSIFAIVRANSANIGCDGTIATAVDTVLGNREIWGTGAVARFGGCYLAQ